MATSTVWSQGGGRRERGGFSLSNLTSGKTEVPDSVLLMDSAIIKEKRITAYQLTRSIGDPYMAPMDTNRLNYGNSTLVEAKSVGIGYLANVGSPAQTKIFSERKEARDFVYADAYDYYITTPENAYFYDTKLPYTNIMYAQAGGSQTREDQLKGVLTWNFGKRINMGGEMDYIYSRGQYNSNGNKLLSYRLFGSYRSDKYELFAYLSNYNLVNYENGGLANDEYLRDPDQFREEGRQAFTRKNYPTRMNNTWNRVRGKQYFLSHRYNLGFTRELQEEDEEGNPKEIFIPVSSIIHTMEYEDNRRHFTSKMEGIDTCYTETDYNQKELQHIYGLDPSLSDRSSAWNLKNTVALSLREGFQDWAKFGLTAFATFEKRRFKLPAQIPGVSYGTEANEIWQNGSGENPQPEGWDFPFSEIHDEFSTYLGGELSKRKGSILTYNARGEFCLVGDDIGEFRINGDLETRFPLFGKEASIRANGYIRNVTPAFFQRHHHSRYFWWDGYNSKSLDKTQQFYVGGEVHLASTGTTVSAGVESIQKYVYNDSTGRINQYNGNIQVVSARLKQDIHYKAFGWESEVVYQLSSKKEVLPLPDLSAYTNLYFHFKLAKVLTVQLGTDVHYHTKYYAPYYEPATQQFQLQYGDKGKERVKVGNFPLINAYVNFHLKQARFFVMGYNLGSLFMEPNHFSLAHYPSNPMVIKMGIAVLFNN